MKIASLIAALVATAALTALGQEGVVQDVKHGAKKAGETIKNGLETADEKTKETAKTVGKKTKETAQRVAEKTKQTVNGTTENATRDNSDNTSQAQKDVQQGNDPNHGRTDDKSRVRYTRTKPNALTLNRRKS